MGQHPKSYSRVTLLAASEALESHSQAAFNRMVLRLELEDHIPESDAMSVATKCVKLARLVVQLSEQPLKTLDGDTTVGEAVVREAAAVLIEESQWPPQEKFERALLQDRYSLAWNQDGKATLRPSLPVELEANTSDEVHQLLEAAGFTTLIGHLDQALNAHLRGDWAASNGQLRTFIEGLLDEIADSLRPDETANRTSENQWVLLGKTGYLYRDLNGTSGGAEEGFLDQPAGFHGFSGPAAAGQPVSLMGTFRLEFTPRSWNARFWTGVGLVTTDSRLSP